MSHFYIKCRKKHFLYQNIVISHRNLNFQDSKMMSLQRIINVIGCAYIIKESLFSLIILHYIHHSMIPQIDYYETMKNFHTKLNLKFDPNYVFLSCARNLNNIFLVSYTAIYACSSIISSILCSKQIQTPTQMHKHVSTNIKKL